MPRLNRLRLVCILALGLGRALSTEAWTSSQHGAASSLAGLSVPASLVVEQESCDIGHVEGFLADWLDASAEAQFESLYVAMVFDEFVLLVGRLRDLAEEMCL